MDITSFMMEKVRCFADRQEFRIRPLTFLIGENSTGKTTTLGCLQVLADYLAREVRVNFDRSPYRMGVFKDIVTSSRPAETDFKLGFSLHNKGEEISYIVEFMKRKEGFDPVINTVRLKFRDGKVLFKRAGVARGERHSPFQRVQHRGKNNFTVECEEEFMDRPLPIVHLPMFFFTEEANGRSEPANALVNYLKKKGQAIEAISFMFSLASMPPVRSSPERNYSPSAMTDDPAGSDMPMQLLRMETTRKDEWESLTAKLAEFGKESGLFKAVRIKKFGKSGGPFQLQFKVRSHSSSILDVGYGVSQILPILVRILHEPRAMPHFMKAQRRYFLIQQPEVHLHPRAQAEFSSLLAGLAGQGKRGFIVETHSDNIIDRARIEIRRKTIKPEDVSLIYLQAAKGGVKVHNIKFDEMANMLDVPAGYRKFFAREGDRLMGVES